MGWRNIMVGSPAKLSVKMGSMVVDYGDGASIPIEDIATVLIENNKVVMTTGLINNLSANGTLVYCCDDRHMPSCIIMPFQPHSRQLKAYKEQIGWTEPLKKRIWQNITKQKITNQGRCLEILKKKGSGYLYNLVPNVTSGDTTYRESVASKHYFVKLFGENFKRFEDDPINHALNYGYTIFRGAVARALTVYGFLSAMGVHHRNELNNFNLADDFIEPLRPLVDIWTAENKDADTALDRKDRMNLYNLLNCNVIIRKRRETVLRATEIMAESLVSAGRKKDPSLIRLPVLIPLEQHEYE